MKHTKTKEQWYQDFMSHREAYGRKKPANDFTRCFLNWCMHTYPDEEYLTQEMLEVWGDKTEHGKSSVTRSQGNCGKSLCRVHKRTRRRPIQSH